jgi:hypothetical protein
VACFAIQHIISTLEKTLELNDMAKVFATLIENNAVVLKQWPSKAAFQSAESWVDNKFIAIATTDDFKGKSSFPANAMYDFEIGPPDEYPKSKSFHIIQSKEEVQSHNLLFNARNEHLGITA